MHKIKLQGEIDSWGYARYLLEYDLRQVPEGEPVVLEIDSLGGDVMEAISISNMLMERGNVTAHIVGFVASAATWLCYGCDKVIINDDCAYLIHKCSSYIDAWGMMNADELDALIEKLKSEKKSNEAIDLIIAQKYAKHSKGKLDVKGALKLMKEERWMLPEEALSLGLVDEVSEEHVLAKSNYAARLHVMNSMQGMPKLPEKFMEKDGRTERREPDGDGQPVVPQDEKKSFVQRVKEALTELFGGSVAMLARTADSGTTVLPEVEYASTEEESVVNQKIEVIMNKKYQTVNQFLAVEGIEEQDGCLLVPADDMQKIDDRLQAADGLQQNVDTLTTERDQARQSLADLEATIDALSPEIAGKANLAEKLDAIKDLLAKVTNVTTEVHAQNEGNGHKEETYASDPVNKVVQAYR